MPKPRKPRVFVDADVLFAGSASPSAYGASLVVLRMAEITLIEVLTSQQVIAEVERNLSTKIPESLPTFRLLVDRCLTIVSDPRREALEDHVGLADAKDLPILVAATREKCPWLVTFNIDDFQPGHPSVTVLRPGDFVLQVRGLLAHLSPK